MRRGEEAFISIHVHGLVVLAKNSNTSQRVFYGSLQDDVVVIRGPTTSKYECFNQQGQTRYETPFRRRKS